MSFYQFGFEKLKTWQEARKLTAIIYEMTNDFPREERFGIIQQLRRAAISICSNITEGSARISPKDQAHFTNLSYSSLMELLNDLIISSDLGYLKNEKLNMLRRYIQQLSIKLSNLKKSQIERLNRKSGFEIIF